MQKMSMVPLGFLTNTTKWMGVLKSSREQYQGTMFVGVFNPALHILDLQNLETVK